MLEELLRIENGKIEKNGQELMKELYLQAYKGEILGLISDNIREKQCIIDILNGSVDLDHGWIFFDDKLIHYDEASQILKNKIAVIESKSKLVDNLTIAENIFVVRGGFKKYFVNKKLLYRQARGLLSDFKLDIRPELYAGRLTHLERYLVELMKAYATGHRLIVCSDLTSFLSSTDVEKVIQVILWLKKKGVGFIIIENYDDALFQYSDRVAIIYRGKTVRIFNREEIDKRTIYSLLMGEVRETTKSDNMNEISPPTFHSSVVFDLKQTSLEQSFDLSFHIHQGEIINILYQDEESASELLKLLRGEMKSEGNEMRLESKKYNPTGLWDAIKKGVCFIDENPISTMLFYDMSVLDNLCFTMSNKVKGLWFHRKYRNSIMKNMDYFFDQKLLYMPITKLEPIELQKIAYSKWLLYLPKVVVCKKPFSAVDVHMKQVTEQLLNTYTKKGISVIILTSNISEAHTMGDKVFYLKGESK